MQILITCIIDLLLYRDKIVKTTNTKYNIVIVNSQQTYFVENVIDFQKR